jgi:beta-glucosidase
VIADGQIIDLSGSGNELGFLGAAGFGAASGSGTITYTDGTTQPYSISMADWFNNAAISGDQIATTTTSWNFASSTQTPHPVSVYFASVALDPNKTVASVTLPTVGSGVGNNINAMHIFSIATGNGTPTGGAGSSVSATAGSRTRGEAHFKARG